MDYGDILKRAWRITWRYKALWVLGLFAGVAGGSSGGGGSSGYRAGGGTGTGTGTAANPFGTYQWTLFTDFVRQHLVAIAIVTALIVLFGLVMWVLGVAARGGLIHLANEASEGHVVRLSDGWGTGFRNWGRVFGVEFLTALPMIVLALTLVGFLVLIAGSALSRGVAAGSYESALASLALTGLCFLGIFAVIALVLGTILGIVARVATRYVVLFHGYTIRGSIAQGWRDLWSRRGAFVMYLVTLGTGIAFGIVAAMVAAVFVVPALLMFVARAWMAGAAVIALGVLVLLLPSAVYATFHSALWTVFFRKMTGMEPAAVPASPAYAAPHAAVPASTYTPPGPYAAPIPPAPPAPPAGPGPADV